RLPLEPAAAAPRTSESGESPAFALPALRRGRRRPEPRLQPVCGGGVVALDFTERIAAEFLEKRIGEHEAHDSLAHDGRGGDRADVASLDHGRRGAHADEID